MLYDLIVVGGGPGGLATAIHAAAAGLSAVVLERRTAPPDKACGEGLMPRGAAALDEMDVRLPPHERAAFTGIRYLEGASVAEASFPGLPGLGVRRSTLTAALGSRAQELGAELRHGSPVRRWRRSKGGVEVEAPSCVVRGRLLVGADGLHSRVRAWAGLEGRSAGLRRYGMRRHFRVVPWTERVEVHWSPAGEAYVTPVGPDRVGVAILWGGGGAGSGGRADLFALRLAGFPALTQRLAGAEPASEPLGAGPMLQRVRRRWAEGVALVGDAAGSVDAITGEGVGLAFESARALVEVVAGGRPLAAYEAAYRRLAWRYYLTTGTLLAALRRPRLRRRIVPLLASRPSLFRRLLGLVAGPAAPAS